MVGQSQLTIAEWAYPEVLFGFLDELQGDGYNLGTSHYGAAQDLLLALAAESGSSRETSDRFTRLLGPLLCSTPREQEEFQSLVARWSDGAGQILAEACKERDRTGAQAEVSLETPAPVTSPAEPPHNRRLAGVLRRIERGFRTWRWAVAIAVAVLLIGVFLFSPRGVSQQSRPLPGPQSSGNVSYLSPLGWSLAVAGFLAVAYLSWRLWLGLVARQFLARQTSTEPPALQRITILAEDSKLFAERSFQRVAQQLRRRILVPGRDLDLEATVEQTACQGGWPKPVTGRRLVRPEYLALIERAGPGDQRTRLADDLSERLAGQGILLERAYFDADPRTCFRLGSATATLPASLTPISLRELYSRYPEHRLLLITGGEGLFSPTSGELVSWIDQFFDWEHRAVLTPRPVEQWGRHERYLAQHFTVLPATLDGMGTLAMAFGEGGARSVRTLGETDSATRRELLPEELRIRPQRWLGRTAPDPWLVEEVIGGLEQYLGEAGFYWLSACAVYPELNWNFTLALGKALTTESGEPLLDSRRLATLVELPWFRHGSMPDWLRRRLLSRLSRQREAKVRAAIEALFLTALEENSAAAGESFRLIIVGSHQIALKHLWKPVWRRLSKQSGIEQPIQDYVFREFMAIRRRRLSIALPGSVLRLLTRKSKSQPRIELPSPALQRAQVAIGFGFAALWAMMSYRAPRVEISFWRFLQFPVVFIAYSILGIVYVWRSTWRQFVFFALLFFGLFFGITLMVGYYPYIPELASRLSLLGSPLAGVLVHRFLKLRHVVRRRRITRIRRILVTANIMFVAYCLVIGTTSPRSYQNIELIIVFVFLATYLAGPPLALIGYIERSGWLAAAGLQFLGLGGLQLWSQTTPVAGPIQRLIQLVMVVLLLVASFVSWRKLR